MIVPMKKVSLMVLGDRKEKALKKLRKLGLLHIEITEGSGEKLTELREQLALLEDSLFTVGEKIKKDTPDKSITSAEALNAAIKISDLKEKKNLYISEQLTLKSELERLKGWGEIDIDKLNALSEKGIDITFYEMPLAEYKGLGNGVKTLILSKSKKYVKCLIIGEKDVEKEISASISAYKVILPKSSTDEIRREITEKENRINEIDTQLTLYAEYSSGMKKAIKEIEKEIEFEVFSTGMDNESLSDNTDKDLSVSYFKGYIEAENLDKLKTEAKASSWGLIAEDPTEEDDVPTKLKNNRFVSLIYPLTDFLGTVPGYFEYDISGWFLAFILIFFGIIFGDGGYGLFILAVAAIPIIKSLITKKAVSPLFLLVGLFGLSTIIWGTLTCTWFGLSPDQLPNWIKNISVPVISNVYADKIWHPFWTNGSIGLTTAQNLQILCFSLALIQLTVAHIKGAIRNRNNLKVLSDIGSILQLLGIFYVVLSFVVNSDVFSFGLIIGGIPIGTVSILLVGVGFLMSFIFANYNGSVIKSVLESLKNIVSVLLGVVNVFSDIVSYIRLWAVGLAGAAISATVNELAGPLLGNFLFMILAIVLLVFGHGLNMILNVLSVIVHGIRLNTLEFSSHLDMSWSGHKFKPFEE